MFECSTPKTQIQFRNSQLSYLNFASDQRKSKNVCSFESIRLLCRMPAQIGKTFNWIHSLANFICKILRSQSVSQSVEWHVYIFPYMYNVQSHSETNERIEINLNNSQKSKFHFEFAIYTSNEKIFGFVLCMMEIFRFNGETNEFCTE